MTRWLEGDLPSPEPRNNGPGPSNYPEKGKITNSIVVGGRKPFLSWQFEGLIRGHYPKERGGPMLTGWRRQAEMTFWFPSFATIFHAPTMPEKPVAEVLSRLVLFRSKPKQIDTNSGQVKVNDSPRKKKSVRPP